jgi:hypothetical protein
MAAEQTAEFTCLHDELADQPGDTAIDMQPIEPEQRQAFTWAGRALDAEVDLQYNRARGYGATHGRMLPRNS